jgi:hypothetical protein
MAYKKTTFAEAMRGDMNAQKLLPGGKWSPENYEASFGRNILHEDLDYIGDGSPKTVYSLDDDTRDRLIAHCRQDVAMSYAAISNLRKEMRNLRFQLSLSVLVIVGLLIFHIFA